MYLYKNSTMAKNVISMKKTTIKLLLAILVLGPLSQNTIRAMNQNQVAPEELSVLAPLFRGLNSIAGMQIVDITPGIQDQNRNASPMAEGLNTEKKRKNNHITATSIIENRLKKIFPQNEAKCLCTICQGDINPYEGLKLAYCLHTFHSKCISKSLAQSFSIGRELICPNCRQKIDIAKGADL